MDDLRNGRKTSYILSAEGQEQEILRYENKDLLRKGSILKEKLIAHFDLNEDLCKEATLGYLKENWNKVLCRLPDINWLSKDNEIQADWCMDYIQKKQCDLLIRGLAPVSSEEKIRAIIGSLDTADINRFHPAEIELFINKMKGAWSSKKNRSNEKKNMNHRVSPEAFDKFNELCKRQYLSKSMMLEKLIAQEYERTCKKR